MNRIVDVENELARTAEALTAPRSAECLYCYLCRMLDEFGCTNDHRFTARWAQARRVPGRPVLQ